MPVAYLTETEFQTYEWVIDSLEDYWTTEIDKADPDHRVPRPVVFPCVVQPFKNGIEIHNVHPDVLADLRYRLVTQLDEMRAADGEKNADGKWAWREIAEASGIDFSEYDECGRCH